jgi:hypothetical protein
VFRLRREGIIRPGAASALLEVAGIEVTIPLAIRPGTLGGEVILFQCPHCSSRRWYLYVLDGKVRCQDCFQAGWATHWCRGTAAAARVRRLQRRLEALPPGAKARRAKLLEAFWIARAKAFARLSGLLERGVREHERRKRKRHAASDTGGS